MEHRSFSIADQVFETLEHDILTGAYERGELLTELKLCEKLGVSRTPVREAMRRLWQEHLIEMTSKGARVIGLTPADIADIFEIRLRLEGLCARWTAARATAEGLGKLRETLSLQEFYTARNDPENIQKMDSLFHQTLYELCGSPALRDTLEPLYRRIQKYRRVSLTAHRRSELSLREHQAILGAISAQNGAQAEELATRHVCNARDHIILEGNADHSRKGAEHHDGLSDC